MQFRQQRMAVISRGVLGASNALGPDPWIIFLMENGHITCSSNCVTTIASRKTSVMQQGKMFLWTILLFRYWHDLGHWVWVQAPHSFDGNLTRHRYAWFTNSMHGLPGKLVLSSAISSHRAKSSILRQRVWNVQKCCLVMKDIVQTKTITVSHSYFSDTSSYRTSSL